MHRRIRIVDSGQTECPLHRLKQFKIYAGVLADLPGGHVCAVIAHDATRRHLHRREVAADVLERETFRQKPLDQFRPFGARHPLETVEQSRGLDRLPRVVGHRLNVYRPAMTGPLLEGLPPIVGENARILILGNMPSVMSLAAQQYYGNPRNAFWTITGEIFGFDPSASYDDRTKSLRDRGVAVWDVLRLCRRQGSLDSAIEPDSMVANDFGQFFDAHRAIDRVFFNGAAAEKNFGRLAGIELALRYRRLPSTSPAQTMRYQDKLLAWREALG